jgi:peptidoglycan-associated lipoprotein
VPPAATDGLAGKAIDTELAPNATGVPLADDDWSNYVHDRDAFKSDTVYFAYDSVTLRKDELKKLDAIVASFQNAPAACKVGIEGNCDERGTPEYNRSLGERRALAAREYLVNKGVAASRILTISYGEDKPVTTGHDDTAWSKNRRDEFVLLRPKALAGSQ